MVVIYFLHHARQIPRPEQVRREGPKHLQCHAIRIWIEDAHSLAPRRVEEVADGPNVHVGSLVLLLLLVSERFGTGGNATAHAERGFRPPLARTIFLLVRLEDREGRKRGVRAVKVLEI